MPKLKGWEKPDWKAMSREELIHHLEKMSEIGEAYKRHYGSGKWPLSEAQWQEWWDLTTPEFRVYYPFMPDDTDMLVSDMMAMMPPMHEDQNFKSMRQEDVHIHPFPGGCLFEQVSVMTLPDGTEVRKPGVHVFYLNEDGKIVRSHEYYQMDNMDTFMKK